MFDNFYSFLHPAKYGFLFILKNVLFEEINDTEIPITLIKKKISKNQRLTILGIWGKTCHMKKKIN